MLTFRIAYKAYFTMRLATSSMRPEEGAPVKATAMLFVPRTLAEQLMRRPHCLGVVVGAALTVGLPADEGSPCSRSSGSSPGSNAASPVSTTRFGCQTHVYGARLCVGWRGRERLGPEQDREGGQVGTSREDSRGTQRSRKTHR